MRVSASIKRKLYLYWRNEDAVGATLQDGRRLFGAASIILDLLPAPTHVRSSVLLFSSPGSPKMAMIRNVMCILTEEPRVVVVDSNNKVGGKSADHYAFVKDATSFSVLNCIKIDRVFQNP